MMRFLLGDINVTDGAIQALSDSGGGASVAVTLLRRHASCDFGEMDAEDVAVNQSAVDWGGRILSQYTLPNGERVWIITEADRSRTTFLLPDEY